jgi:hypothetical protein
MAMFILGVWVGALFAFGLMSILSVSSKSDDLLERQAGRKNCKRCLYYASDVQATVQQDTETISQPVRRISHGEMVQMELEAKALQKENEVK